MKIADKQTSYILLKAETNSEWDSCDFALINLTENWGGVQRKRIQDAKQFQQDSTFCALTYYTWEIQFYTDDDEICKSAHQLLDEKQWAFISISKKNLERLSVPENKLEGYKLLIYPDGTAIYKVSGMYSGENFCTAVFPLHEIIERLSEQH